MHLFTFETFWQIIVGTCTRVQTKQDLFEQHPFVIDFIVILKSIDQTWRNYTVSGNVRSKITWLIVGFFAVFIWISTKSNHGNISWFFCSELSVSISYDFCSQFYVKIFKFGILAPFFMWWMLIIELKNFHAGEVSNFYHLMKSWKPCSTEDHSAQCIFASWKKLPSHMSCS